MWTVREKCCGGLGLQLRPVGGVFGFQLKQRSKRRPSGLLGWSKQGRCIKCTGLGLGSMASRVKDLGF